MGNAMVARFVVVKCFLQGSDNGQGAWLAWLAGMAMTYCLLTTSMSLLIVVLLSDYSVCNLTHVVSTGNHKAILTDAGYKDIREYRYFKKETRGLDYEGMIDDLKVR